MTSSRRLCRAAAAVSATVTALAVPAAALIVAAPATAQDAPKPLDRVAPADREQADRAIGLAGDARAVVEEAAPVDDLGRPSPAVLTLVEDFAHQPGMPEEVSGTLLTLVGFFRGDGEPGAEVPQNGPVFTQFGWPTVARKCIGGTENAVGTAIAVPGPAPIPLPGVPAFQTGFVFTALGTGPAVEGDAAMQVNWLNVSTGAMGQTPLLPGTINNDGPGTVNGFADTGSGTVVAVLSGGVTTQEASGPAHCEFAPTVGITTVK